jgi:hypothetical protein
LVGLEADRQINILSKANMLIHLAEKYRELPAAGRRSFADLMNRTFLLTDHDRALGALEFPASKQFDLVITNPPYVVKGTKLIRQKIAQTDALEKFYKSSGTGTESLFLRYIVDSLKPGGRAFVIVPTGLLTRSETAVRGYIRKHCTVDAIVSLPARTFYNTQNPTYIICLTAMTDQNEIQQSPVFAYLVREVGEERDARRFPCRSDLPDLVRQFRAFQADREVFEPRNLNCKLIPIADLSPSERWDVDRFWNDQERRELGLGEISAISIDQFESELASTMESVNFEIEQLRAEIPTEPRYTSIQLSDTRFFRLIRGQRVTKKNVHDHSGDVPVISGHGEAESYLGFVSEAWLRTEGITIRTTPLITVNANGSVGDVFLRTEPRYVIHDDVIGIDVVSAGVDPLYAVYAIRESVAKARFRWDAKLYLKRLRPLAIRVPVDENGALDVQQQQALATQYERLETLKASIQKLAGELEDRFITVDFTSKPTSAAKER